MSPLCAAGTSCGTAGASAFRMVSITVGSAMLQRPSAAGGLRAQHRAVGQDHFERAEAAFVDIEIGRGERLEGHARRRDAAGAAGIERRRHLRIHLGEVDRHLRAVAPAP